MSQDVQTGQAARLRCWKSYLERGADPNWGDANWNTMGWVALAGDVEGLQLLFAHNGDPHSTRNGSESLMGAAAEFGNPATMSLLLQKGVSVNGEGTNNPLYLAFRRRRVENVRFLLQHGADPNVEVLGKRLIDAYSPDPTTRDSALKPEQPDKDIEPKMAEIMALLKAYGARR
jgi:ankyrin repeat protein